MCRLSQASGIRCLKDPICRAESLHRRAIEGGLARTVYRQRSRVSWSERSGRCKESSHTKHQKPNNEVALPCCGRVRLKITKSMDGHGVQVRPRLVYSNRVQKGTTKGVPGARRADKPQPLICSAKLSITTQPGVSIETSSTTRSLRRKISITLTPMALATREASLFTRLQEQRRGRLWGLPTRTLTSHSESRWGEIRGL